MAWIRMLIGMAVCQDGIGGPPGPDPNAEPLKSLVVGSCARQDRPAPLWETMAKSRPDCVVLLGDNIYGDSRDPEVLRSKYQKLVANPGFANLRKDRALMATWDDHDYGENDSGAEYPAKDLSKKLFLEFLGKGEGDPRSTRPGIFESRIFGPPGKRVQVILLDTRWFRTPLAKREGRKGEYAPLDDPNSTFLGEEQWAWFEKELAREAEIRLIGSSIQVIPEEHPFEKWANFPRERERFLGLLEKSGASGVILLSGDRHLGEISCLSPRPGTGNYPLFEMTASGINQGSQKFRLPEANRHRVASLAWGNHFGVVRIDWAKEDPEIRLELRDEQGETVVSSRLGLSNISRKGPPSVPVTLRDGEIGPSGVATKVGQEVRLRFRVASTGKSKDGARVFLNTNENYRDRDNVTVVLDMAELGNSLADKGFGDPSGKLAGKELVAVGKIELFRESPQIVIRKIENLVIEK